MAWQVKRILEDLNKTFDYRNFKGCIFYSIYIFNGFIDLAFAGQPQPPNFQKTGMTLLLYCPPLDLTCNDVIHLSVGELAYFLKNCSTKKSFQIQIASSS